MEYIHAADLINDIASPLSLPKNSVIICNSMEKIKAVIVGLGRIASLLEEDSLREKPCTHAGALNANPACILVAGCDTDEEHRRLFAEKWQVPVYADTAEMIWLHKPQILVIATYPDSHYHYCRLAAEMGVPVLICEKPLSDNIGEARKIAILAKRGAQKVIDQDAHSANRRGPVIITNHERRYSQDYIKAKAILEQEKLGALLSVRANLYMGKNKKLLDVFWHDGTHLADAIMFLTGAALKHRRCWGTSLNARLGTAWLEGELRREKSMPPIPDLIEIGAGRDPSNPQDYSAPAPIPVLIEIGAGRDHLVFEMEFSCEKGRLRIGNDVFEVWESAPSPYAEKFRSPKRVEETFEGPTGYFANMVEDALACVNDPQKLPHSSAADGLRVIEYLHSVKAWR
ncbi:MAG: Gfo/Idh/MocA family oxidoreductase [Treponema sp.]|jgi:predicted dehydrogenase|nr:Gfo/Idh/MocA family oxidoreductase [Treponema sp.]